MKNIVITGASSGIGKAIYDYFHENYEGHEYDTIVGVSRRGPDYFLDVAKYLPINPIQKDIALLINCAGIMPLDESEVSQYIFDVNFWGTVHIIHNLLPEFLPGCCVINIASVSGLRGDKEVPFYAASKAAVLSFTQSYAKRYAPHYRFNCISPGFYKTNLVPVPTPDELIQTVPLQYEEKPEEIIPVIEMIIKTKYMTGANIVVDGGVSL